MWENTCQFYSTVELEGERGPYKPIGQKSWRWVSSIQHKRSEYLPDIADAIVNGESVFFFSDPHFDHANIIHLSSRPFSDLETMQQALWASVVAASTKGRVICLGDLALRDPLSWQKKFSGLGNTLTIVGNHDAKNWDLVPWLATNARGWGSFQLPISWCKEHFSSHELVNWDSLPPYMSFGMFHWPVPKEFYPKGLWAQLHGHTHSVQRQPTHMNVCVEALDYEPRTFQELFTFDVFLESIDAYRTQK